MRTVMALIVTAGLLGPVVALTLSALPFPAASDGPAGALVRTVHAARDAVAPLVGQAAGPGAARPGIRHRP